MDCSWRARVGKHTDELIEELVTSTEGKTDCQQWDTDGWGGYEQMLPPEVKHYIGKDQTQRLERTNGIIRQQTGRWHRDSEQVWEAVGADQGNNTIGSELLQLDVVTQSVW